MFTVSLFTLSFIQGRSDIFSAGLVVYTHRQKRLNDAELRLHSTIGLMFLLLSCSKYNFWDMFFLPTHSSTLTF
jgi:hypothetical protein